MDKRNVLKFIYWEVMPIAIGFVSFYYINKMNVSAWEKLFIFVAVILPISMVRVSIGMRLFKERPTLAEKIMSCNLRRRYGNSYCADCPDSFACATNAEKVK